MNAVLSQIDNNEYAHITVVKLRKMN